MASVVKLGTFNINNLFDRFDDPYNREEPDYRMHIKYRRPIQLIRLWKRAAVIQGGGTEPPEPADVLALQEVENKGALWEFNASHLGSYFKHLVLIEANDWRSIEVAVASNLPIGPVTTHQYCTYPDSPRPDGKVFSRDLLELDILHRQRPHNRLFTLYVTHLKSGFINRRVRSREKREEKERYNNELRQVQARMLVDIVQKRFAGEEAPLYAIAGDFNDTLDSEALAPLAALGCYNPVEELPEEDRWTFRFKGQKRQYDYILLSPALAEKLVPGSVIVDRMEGHSEASDHHPVYVTLRI